MKIERNRIAGLICLVFIFLFAYTATSKILAHSLFRFQLSEFPLISSLSNFIAWMVPLSELIVTVLLFIPSFRIWGLRGSFGLMVIFTAYIFYLLVFAPTRPCSCGGMLGRMTWNQHLIFNLGLIALSLVGLNLYSKDKIFIAINRESRTPV